MAVYEQTYRRYDGELTAERWRFTVPLRYAFREAATSKLSLLLLILGVLVPLAGAVIIYLRHNLQVLTAVNLPLDRLVPIDNTFFSFLLQAQSSLGFFLALLIGPGLVAPDLRNNALPLYFSRPFTPAEYVLGKLGVLTVLLSALTWIPDLLLFLFQASLEPGWAGKNLGIAWALFAASWEWTLVLGLLTLAISAWVKWKPVARVALLVLFFVLRGGAAIVNHLLRTTWGSLFSLGELNDIVRNSLFDLPKTANVPVGAAWTALAAACLLFLLMLRRRLRAYEVVR
jgi:ABC-2 type transport system permease protein